MKTLPTFALLLVMRMIPGICHEENDDRGYSFEYRLHHGLDCSQLSSCGFRIEITRTGVMQHFEETGSWVLTAEKQLSLEESEALKALLDEYFRLLTEPVKEHDGVIIQTTGDSMISLWRCAEHDDAPIERACLSAIDIQVASARFDMIHADQTLRTRIGLHFGQVIVGNVGGSGHFNYTVTGDAVNVAARLEGLNKHVGTSILASGEVVKHARSSFARRLGCFVLVGLEEPISVFEIICRREHASDPLLRSSHDFARALATFETGQHHAAAEQFEVVLQHEIENGPAKFFRDLCHGQLSAQAEVDSAGIIWMKQK